MRINIASYYITITTRNTNPTRSYYVMEVTESLFCL